MGGINSLSGLNTLSVDYRPQTEATAPNAGNVNQPQQDDDNIIINGVQAAQPQSIVRQLDTLLLNAAGKAVSDSAETKMDAVTESLAFKGVLTEEECDRLDNLAEDAAAKLKALDNFSGRELAKVLMTKSGELVWRKGFFGGMTPVTLAVKAAVEAQEALSEALSKLNDRIAQSDEVDAKLQEDFTELQFQCDRRATEIYSIVVRMHDLAQRDTVNGLIDEQVLNYLDATFKELMPREAILMHGTAEALETIKAKFAEEMQPVADKLGGLAADPNKTLSVQDVAELDAGMASMKNVLDHVRKNGIEIGTGRTEVDKTILDEMEKILADVKEKVAGAKEESVMRARRAFHRDVFATFSLDRLPNGRNIMDGGGKSNNVLVQFVNATANLATMLDQFATGARPMGEFDDAFNVCEANFPKSETLKNEMVKVGFPSDVATNFVKVINEIVIVKAQFKELMNIGDALRANAADSTLIAEDVRNFMIGGERLSVYIEAKSRGYLRGDVDPKTDADNIAWARRLGSGVAGSTYLLTTRSGEEVVFKPEIDGRLGLNKLALGATANYRDSQTTANLNLATQQTAKAFGCEDLVVKYSVGVHDGQFGTFMEKAKGYPGKDFAYKNDGNNGGIPPSELKNRITDPQERLRIQAKIAQKLNRLMWLDMLTGQGDRHWDNYFVHIDESTHEVTVKGIDNDASFSATRVGMQKYVVTGNLAQALIDEIGEVCVTLHGPLGGDEFRRRILSDPGLTVNQAQEIVIVDLSKAKSPEIAMGTMELIGLKSIALPQELDKDLYDKLIDMDQHPEKKRAYLDSIAPRLSPDSLRAAEMRLDDVIAHAKKLNAENKVYSDEDWQDPLVLQGLTKMKGGVRIEMSIGTTVDFGNDIDVVKDYTENNTPSIYTREFFHMMFQ